MTRADRLRRLDVALHDRTEDGGTSFIQHFWQSSVPTAKPRREVPHGLWSPAMSDTDAVNLALLLFRVVVAIIFLAHGIRHIFGGGKIAGTGRWFASLGVRPGIVHAWFASVTEVAAGVMLVLGFLTPLA